MKKRTYFWIILVFSVCAVAGIVFFLLPEPQTAAVTLPVQENVTEDSSEEPSNGNDSRLEINCSNVQAVISTLKEQETYSRNITITRSWSAGSSTDELAVRKKGDSCSIEVNGEKSILITDETVYILYDGSKSFYSGPAAEGDALSYQELIDFSEVLSLDKSLIQGAGYCDHNGTMCIYVSYEAGLPGYTRQCYASIEYGLLMGCTETSEDGSIVYEMESSLPDLTTPKDDYFTVPS